jgi:hypothetical protein
MMVGTTKIVDKSNSPQAKLLKVLNNLNIVLGFGGTLGFRVFDCREVFRVW